MRKLSTRFLTIVLAFAMIMPSIFVGTIPAIAEDVVADSEQVETPDNSTIITHSNYLANGVQAQFYDYTREQFEIKNQQMTLSYNLKENGNKQVASLTNENGAYFENTMDAFVTIDGKERVYASDSSSAATANLHRLGYYYYDARFEGQDFITESTVMSEDVKKFWVSNVTDVEITSGGSKWSPGKVSGTLTNNNDPQIVFGNSDNVLAKSIEYSADTYNYIRIKMTVSEGITGAAFYYNDSTATGFTDPSKYVSFDVINDGTEQTYMVPMFNGSGYSGTIGHLRLDFSGAVGSTFTISELAVVQVDTGDSIEGLQVARSFLVYSDKMHSFTQFATTKTVNNIENFGVEVKIPTEKVGSYVIKANGVTYNDLENIPEEANADYAGFYITDVGVFGYIMPYDGSGGKLTVTVEDGNYVIRQTNTPKNGTLNPSEAGTDNGNDFYIGQRLYTDTNTTLDAFEIEAELERNPLTSDNITVSADCDGSFAGYDALRGIYKFSIEGFDGFSEPAYAAVNKHFNVNFTITGDNNNRKIWAMTATTGGCLESAVLLDANEMLIPVPIQVGKNFQEENTRLFSIDDTPYGEAIFPMDIKANSSAEYTVVNAYQNWGKYPLKQISWIQFSTPYYHLSTGVTESTCITPMYSTKSNTRTFLTLPDFRPMSAPYWSNAPQHNTCGDHRWLLYTDSNGNFNGTENYNNVITSHGPTYAEIEMQNISDDGSISVTYTHMEMPQTDENRTYYQIKYEILKDVSFTDFSRDFQFYSVESLDPTGLYQRVGYLDSNNSCQVTTAQAKGSSAQYQLGSYYPYFSFFDMDNATSEHNNGGYSNVAMLICNSDLNSLVDNNAGVYPRFVVNDLGGKLSLSLNMGAITLTKGDSFTINAILLPWGSQEMDGTYDTIQDKNVRDVRADMAQNPVTITPIADPDPHVENAQLTTETVSSVFLPRVKTTNGKEAIFTISGDESNQTIRVDGFTMLTDPKIYEWLESESRWVEYVVCSATTPDVDENGHSYDGYGVYYNEDRTYSYSFVTTLTGKQKRTFKVVADTAFDGWELTVESNASLQNMNVLYAGADLGARNRISDTCAVASEVKTDEINGVSYITFTPNANNRTDFYSTLYNATDPVNTGKYVVVKYRLPSNSAQTGYMEVFTSTKNSAPVGGDNYKFENIVCDDKWHLVIFDIASYGIDTFEVSEDGTCLTKYMRIDFFNASNKLENGEYIDIAYVGMSDSISEILAYDTNYADAIMVHNNGTSDVTAPTENELVKINVASPVINPGDLFLVPVNIENNTGISYLDIMPVYDNQKFTFMGVVNGEVMDGLSRNGSHLIWSNTSNSTKNGTLVYLAFKAKTAMNEGDSAEFSVKVIDAMTTSADGVNTKVTAGSVTFKNFTYGNVDGSEDGKVNISDVVTLRKYIAGSGVSVDTAEADVNCDGVVDLKDITLLRQYMASYDYDTGESSVILGPQIKEGE